MSAPRSHEPRRTRWWIAAWGVLGFGAILVQAIVGLAPLAWEPIAERSLSSVQIGLYIGWVGWMWYAEGYRAFQRQLCPRLVARALHLARNPVAHRVALAPLFCMGLFHATRRRLVLAWAVLLGIVGLVIAVRQLSQPWRGLVDGGVVVGLGWGLGALLVTFGLAIAGREPTVSPELPHEDHA
ncbi:MAG TPA: hypothetical protein VML75_21105 [Kofleriaceae bacterium]|nr:hypothetical protein [Kofleriaceae bacterium]